MENKQGPKGPVHDGFGPRPATRATTHQPLSTSRTALLETLHGQPTPPRLADLVTATGLHANTLREHLEALVKAGLVRRQRAEPRGRGRPAWLYEAVQEGTERTEYAGLAATLASAIHRTSESPREDAIMTGAEWGDDLARRSGYPAAAGKNAARRQVVQLLGKLGFAPETDERRSVVRLTRCPLLEAAYKYPDVVCGVHLGIVRGALEEYGSDPEGTDLFPFSEPGACRLDLSSDLSEPRVAVATPRSDKSGSQRARWTRPSSQTAPSDS